MNRIYRALILGLVIGLLGILCSAIPLGHRLEEDIGLHMLFAMRGKQHPPNDVVIISLDKQSADRMNLPNKPEKWPHSFHAELTEYLAKKGARAITFDIFFSEARSEEDVTAFSRAIRNAGNVILVESIRKDKIALSEEKGKIAGDLHVEKLLPPIPALARSSAAVAPFPLPKVPVKVSQYWTFKTAAGDTPTLPVVVFQVYALDVYDTLLKLMREHSPVQAAKLPRSREEIIQSQGVVPVIKLLREIIQSEPEIAEKMLTDLRQPDAVTTDIGEQQLLTSLITLYRSPSSSFINFYGPPRSVRTVPYHEVFKNLEYSAGSDKGFDFRDKAVFIGSSELNQQEQRDGFYTVFSKSTGLDISGVEIAATAFANILDNAHIQPFTAGRTVWTVFVWGILLGLICCRFPSLFSVMSLTGIFLLYLFVAQYQFRTAGMWYPLVVPSTQVLLVLIISPVWKYITSKKVMKSFLHHKVIHTIERGEDIRKLQSRSQKVYGTCLITDIDGFTQISEDMEPEELNRIMNRYFQTIFERLKDHNVSIKKTIGDSILAAWEGKPRNRSQCHACLSAIDIRKGVQRFNQSSSIKLQTRMGLHCGNMSLGIIGGSDHYEYDIGGDTVNTTKRIEDSNKYLGTRILLSAEVLSNADGILTRKIGKFMFSGKSRPLVLHELLCRTEESTGAQRDLCSSFSQALDDFGNRLWKKAAEKFHQILSQYGKDGPSLFYKNLCDRFLESPPDGSWDGTICFDKK